MICTTIFQEKLTLFSPIFHVNYSIITSIIQTYLLCENSKHKTPIKLGRKTSVIITSTRIGLVTCCYFVRKVFFRFLVSFTYIHPHWCRQFFHLIANQCFLCVCRLQIVFLAGKLFVYLLDYSKKWSRIFLNRPVKFWSLECLNYFHYR